MFRLLLLAAAVSVCLGQWSEGSDSGKGGSDGVSVAESDLGNAQEEATLQNSLNKYQESVRPSRGLPRSIQPSEDQPAADEDGKGRGRTGFGGRGFGAGGRGFGAGGRGFGAGGRGFGAGGRGFGAGVRGWGYGR